MQRYTCRTILWRTTTSNNCHAKFRWYQFENCEHRYRRYVSQSRWRWAGENPNLGIRKAKWIRSRLKESSCLSAVSSCWQRLWSPQIYWLKAEAIMMLCTSRKTLWTWVFRTIYPPRLDSWLCSLRFLRRCLLIHPLTTIRPSRGPRFHARRRYRPFIPQAFLHTHNMTPAQFLLARRHLTGLCHTPWNKPGGSGSRQLLMTYLGGRNISLLWTTIITRPILNRVRRKLWSSEWLYDHSLTLAISCVWF